MGNYFSKAPSSRLNKYQSLQWPGTGTLVCTYFSAETYQIRVSTQLSGWIAVDNIGSVPTSAGGTGAWFPNTSSVGEYFTVTPGQLFSFSSTTTSSGAWVSVCEMS
jgi:hypothetical protein